MVLEDISLNLINIADQVLRDSADLSQTEASAVEYVKNQRKYKLINGESFERIRESDKYLIVADKLNALKENYSLISSYYILSNIGVEIFTTYPELCLTIMGAARELELNKWYDMGLCVTAPKDATFDPSRVKSEALRFASKITKQHVNNGLLLLCASKINFFHTDQTAAKMAESRCLRELITGLFGEDTMDSKELNDAIRCFSYWGSLKGILFKLEAKGLWVDNDLQDRFRKFPDPPESFKHDLVSRYPAGTSKYYFCKRYLLEIAESPYGTVLPLTVEISWLFELCKDIEEDPCKYHVRSSARNLSKHPANVAKLRSPDEIIIFCAAVMHGSNGIIGKRALTASKIPKRADVKNHPVYLKTRHINTIFNKFRFNPGTSYNRYEQNTVLTSIGDVGDKSVYALVRKQLD